MPDEERPPGRRLVLKPKEITPTDTSARPGDGTAISVPLMHRQNRIAEGRRVRGVRDDGPPPAPEAHEAPREPPRLAPREIAATEAAARPGDGTAISVALIHRQNRIAEERRGPAPISMPRRRLSKRTRDFWFLVMLAALVVGALLAQLPWSRATLAMGLVLVGIVAVVLAWVMFGVMDDY